MINRSDRVVLFDEIPCPGCRQPVNDRCPACPRCGEKIYQEHPGDITPTKHKQLEQLRRDG